MILILSIFTAIAPFFELFKKKESARFGVIIKIRPIPIIIIIASLISVYLQWTDSIVQKLESKKIHAQIENQIQDRELTNRQIRVLKANLRLINPSGVLVISQTLNAETNSYGTQFNKIISSLRIPVLHIMTGTSTHKGIQIGFFRNNIADQNIGKTVKIFKGLNLCSTTCPYQIYNNLREINVDFTPSFVIHIGRK